MLRKKVTVLLFLGSVCNIDYHAAVARLSPAASASGSRRSQVKVSHVFPPYELRMVFNREEIPFPSDTISRMPSATALRSPEWTR
jgi:hypothetical protein